jgi:transposase
MAAEKIDANRGDLFEAFFAAAVAARFVKRAKTRSAKSLPKIGSGDVDVVLTEMMKKGYVKNVNDVGSAIIDTVTVNVSIPKKASVFLQDKSNWRKVSDLRDGAVNFANSHSRLNAQARGLSINNRQDKIKITAAGTEDQKGTKADVKVEVDSPMHPDRRFRNVDYSLKVTGGEQFHQVSGLGFDKFLNIFSEMGINVSSVSREYEKKLTEFFDEEVYTKKYSSREDAQRTGGGDNLKASARIVYEKAQEILQQGLNAEGETEVKRKFADYIIYGLSRGVRTELVKFAGSGKVKTRVADRQFRNVLIGHRYVVEIKKTGDPKIEIYLADETGKKMRGKDYFIMQIRYKLEVASGTAAGKKVYRFYPRHYLEAQAGMFLI